MNPTKPNPGKLLCNRGSIRNRNAVVALLLLRPQVLLVALLFCSMGLGQAFAATFAVTNVNDSGAGSLRQAILSANASANVLDTITFNIGGVGPFTITPLTDLPTVIDPVVIDGYTQPGASANTLVNWDVAARKWGYIRDTAHTAWMKLQSATKSGA